MSSIRVEPGIAAGWWLLKSWVPLLQVWNSIQKFHAERFIVLIGWVGLMVGILWRAGGMRQAAEQAADVVRIDECSLLSELGGLK
jgi:hypothetical protein